tara:strand:- start:466 stop:705 length:240 start_codon:yes stop_codon:yes gene_type:complete
MVENDVLKRDVSNRTVILLFVLVIVISLVSIGIYFELAYSGTSSSGETLGAPGSFNPDNQGGKVGLIITPPDERGESNG